MSKSKQCQRCGKTGAVINFCNSCAREISAAHENVVERSRAAVCYLRNKKPVYNGYNNAAQTEFKREETFAFLQIFHPEVSADRAMQIAYSVSDDAARG